MQWTSFGHALLSCVAATMMWGGSLRFASAQDRAFPAAPELTAIRGSLYQLRVNTASTFVYVTPGGIVVGDPLGADTAKWLRTELAARFPGQPVRLLIHSDHRFERAGGASFLGRSAQAVAQKAFNERLRDARTTLPADLSRHDDDHDQRLSAEELSNAPPLLQFDRNGDGSVTPAELYQDVTSVMDSFDRRRRMTIGDRVITLLNLPLGDRRELTVVHFPEERAAFSVIRPDFDGDALIQPFAARDVLAWLDAMVSLDVDLVLDGSGLTIDRTRLTATHARFDALRREVLQSLLDGRSRDDAIAVLSSGNGDELLEARRRELARDVLQGLRLLEMKWFGGLTTVLPRGTSRFCYGYTSCDVGSAIPAGVIGLKGEVDKVGGLVELRLLRGYTTRRDAPLYSETIAHREVALSVLLRSARHGIGLERLPLIAGFDLLFADSRGVAIRKVVSVGARARQPIDSRGLTAGFTLGTDVAPFRGLGVTVPIRLTRGTRPTPDVGRGSWEFRAGLSVDVHTTRKVF